MEVRIRVRLAGLVIYGPPGRRGVASESGISLIGERGKDIGYGAMEDS